MKTKPALYAADTATISTVGEGRPCAEKISGRGRPRAPEPTGARGDLIQSPTLLSCCAGRHSFFLQTPEVFLEIETAYATVPKGGVETSVETSKHVGARPNM